MRAVLKGSKVPSRPRKNTYHPEGHLWLFSLKVQSFIHKNYFGKVIT